MPAPPPPIESDFSLRKMKIAGAILLRADVRKQSAADDGADAGVRADHHRVQMDSDAIRLCNHGAHVVRRPGGDRCWVTWSIAPACGS